LIKYLALSKFFQPNDELDRLSMSDSFDVFSQKLEQNKKNLKTFLLSFEKSSHRSTNRVKNTPPDSISIWWQIGKTC
jgi:hypothetical protein